MQSIEQQSLTFKVKFGDELRRFSVAATSKWEEIISKISTLFNLESGTFTVKYEDDEKELITIDSSLELQEAVRINLSKSTSSLLCIRLELFKSQTPVAVSPSPRSISENSFGVHNGQHGWQHRNQWRQHGHHGGPHSHHFNQNAHPHGRHFNHHASACNIPADELAEKLKILEEKGFKCKMRNIRLLKKFDGDVDKVSEMLLSRKNKGGYAEKLQTLQENGYDNTGINVKLLRRFDGDVTKVMDILTKSKKLEESGRTHVWMNIRLLIRFDGDLEKVEKVWDKKQEKFLQKAEKKRAKCMQKDKSENWKADKKADKKAWKKSCKKGFRNYEH